MIITQHSLVARMRSEILNADWERFYALYEKPILAFAAARSLNEADCCDVLQETMVKMLRGGFTRFDSAKGRFTSFLFHVADCCVIDAIRRRQRTEHRNVSLDHAPRDLPSLNERLADKSETPAAAAERHGQMVLLLEVLDALIRRNCLKSGTVALFKAVTLERKDPKEVARKFQTTAGNVYQAKHAVLGKLRLVLTALDQGLGLDEALDGSIG